MSGVEITQAAKDAAAQFISRSDGDFPELAMLFQTYGDHVCQSATAPLIAALERVAHETRRQQLPITALVHEIAQEALAKHKGAEDGQG